MGHREPTKGFAWPVPPEELADVQVFVLEWNADGRVMVRQQPVAACPPRNGALPRLALPRVEASPAQSGTAPRRSQIQLAWTAEPAARGALRQPVVRNRATWLGIGTLMGIALAASTLPDASTSLNGRRAPVEIPGPPVGTPAGFPAASPALRRVAAVVADTPPVVAPARERRGVQGIVDVAPAATAPRPVADARTRPRTPRPSAATTTAVLQEVRRYEVAYTRMDAAATHAVWPSADRESLVRQFTGLRNAPSSRTLCRRGERRRRSGHVPRDVALPSTAGRPLDARPSRSMAVRPGAASGRVGDRGRRRARRTAVPSALMPRYWPSSTTACTVPCRTARASAAWSRSFWSA